MLEPTKMVSLTMLESENLRKLIDKLQSVGCGKYVELPQIAVMGDTSCGKSSLLSALSGIEFPSSDKLTTRCPTQIVMTNNAKEPNASFDATVQLRRYGKDSNSDIGEPEERLTSIGQITEVIENLTQKLVDEGQEISDDSIVISARGPDLPNLTIIDLPGLVRTVKDGEDEGMIERIRSLVKRYLGQSRTIILSVVPANVDIHNTEILQMAKEVDPEGDRTISVITKPDLVDKGAEESVINLLMNRTKKLKLFYHCVKCRGQKQLKKGTSIADGIKHEKDFFQQTEPWKDVPQDLVGIENLRDKLAKLLEERITESLPSVQKEIRLKQESAKEELEKLGSPLHDSYSRRKYFSDVLDSLKSLMESMIEGKYDRDPAFFLSQETKMKKLRSSLNLLDIDFREAISRVKINVLASEMDIGDRVSILVNDIWLSGNYKLVEKSCGSYKVANEDSEDKNEYELKDFQIRPCIAKLKKKIIENRGDEIPVFPSYSVFVSLVQERIKEFKGPMMKILDAYFDVCRKAYKMAIDHSTIILKVRTFLEAAVLDGFLQDLKAKCLAKLTEEFQKEMRPFTLDGKIYDVFNSMRDHQIISALISLPRNDNDQVHLTSVTSILKNHGIGSSTSIEDQQAIETLMASSAYLKVSQKRFIDNIPMILENSFLRPALHGIKSERMQKSDAELESLLRPSDNVLRKRSNLEDQIKSVTAANELIQKELFGIVSR